MKYKQLRPSQVLLDPDNPRLPDGTSNDHEAINRLLDEGYQALHALARDLVEYNEANPTELPIVLKQGTKYLALEGNRRFAALKLLDNPSLANNARHRSAFERLARKGQPPATVMCAVAASRADAEHWRVLRHTGANNGVGVRGWSTEQQTTHRRRTNTRVEAGTARSFTIADELEEAYARDADLVATIKRVRAAKLTNIGRFFATDMLHRLHLSVRKSDDLHLREETLWAKHTADELHEFFTWAMGFIDNNSVDSYKNATIRRDLLSKNLHLLPDTSGLEDVDERRLADRPYGSEAARSESAGQQDQRGEDPGDHADIGGEADEAEEGRTIDPENTEEAPAGSGASTSKKGKQEARPEKRLFQGLRLPHLSPRTQFLLKEAREIEHEEASGIACIMARVVVELAVSEPTVLAWSGSKEEKPFKHKIMACLRAIDPTIEKPRPANPALAPAYLETQRDFGIEYLHQFVHNPQAYPDASVSRRFSHHWRPVLEAIDARTAAETNP